MKRYLFVASLIAISYSLPAQHKLLTMEDAIVRYRTDLAPEKLRQLQFVYGTEDYVYLKKINDKDVWVKGGLKTTEQPFLSLAGLNQKLKEALSLSLSRLRCAADGQA